jgi:hypothetical protein
MLLVLAGVNITACTEMRDSNEAKEMEPAHVEKVRGTDLKQITLTEKAIERIDLRTDKVREQKVSRSDSPRIVVPYSALIYDPHGKTWVYTSTKQPRTFIRHEVDIDYIEGDIVVLNEGPPVDSLVASVGVAELYGAEFQVGK